jgi:F-type H+-transporting ATPase subunit delta
VRRDVAARRYAEAAYLIAREDGTEDAWSTGLTSVSALYGNPDAQAVFENNRVPLADKRKLIDAALQGVDRNVLNLALLLLRRNRTSLGPQIAEAFQELVDADRGISHATVTTAVPLSDGDRKAVEDRLSAITGGPVVLETNVDESIIGGLVVRIGDRLIDGSTRSSLEALRQRLAGARS